MAVIGVSALFAKYTTVITLVTANALIAAVAVFVCGCVSLWKGEKQARYFMLAWTVLLAA